MRSRWIIGYQVQEVGCSDMLRIDPKIKTEIPGRYSNARREGTSVSAAQMRLGCERSPRKGEGLPPSGKSEGKGQERNCKNAPPSAG